MFKTACQKNWKCGIVNQKKYHVTNLYIFIPKVEILKIHKKKLKYNNSNNKEINEIIHSITI